MIVKSLTSHTQFRTKHLDRQHVFLRSSNTPIWSQRTRISLVRDQHAGAHVAAINNQLFNSATGKRIHIHPQIKHTRHDGPVHTEPHRVDTMHILSK